jgi:hypothetical protein
MPRRQTAAATVERHLADAAKTARLARNILEERLGEIQLDLQRPNLPRDEKARLTLQIVEIAQVLDRSVDAAARSLLRPAPTSPTEPPTAAISADEVIAEITKGKVR